MDGDTSARLDLPYLAAGQLQKHVTLNEALTRLDALVQCTAVSRTTTAQPVSPADGALYILPAGATGPVWGAQGAGVLMRAEAGGWTRIAAPDGLRIWVKDEDQLVVRDGGGWIPLGERIGALQQLTRLGLGTGADAANPFAAKVNTALWTARGAGEGGDGDLRMTLNKEAPTDVLSLLFQSGWGGRAELGLIGDDDLTLKVSADGGSWRAAMVVDRTSGAVAFPAGAGRVETTVFTANGTWTVPSWARRIEAVAVGGGGGGGAGACGASGVTRFGGGGGGAGGASAAIWNVSDLAASLSIAIGAGGASGVGGTAAAGAVGGPGGNSTVTSGGVVILTGRGGAGGAGGLGITPSNEGGASTTTATAGAGAALTRPDGSGGGGAGGGLDTSNTARAGGAGGAGGSTTVSRSGGSGGANASGGNGSAAAAPGLSWSGGGGGGGGGSTATGHSGGAGGTGGAGGGGGGAGVTASGSGGTGGAGLIRVTAIG